MKKQKRVLALFLAGIMAVSSLSGCTSSANNDNITFEKAKRNVRKTIKESDLDFVKDGKSDWTIIIPDDVTENEKFAAEEMQLFVKQATGVELGTKSESKVKGDVKGLYIGNTKAAEKSGVKPTYDDVQNSGFVIKQKDNDVYLLGYSDMGTKNAIYEFLTYMFDFELYAVDEINLTEKKDAKMLAFDMTEVPSFDLRQETYGEIINNSTLRSRMRMNSAEEIMVTGNLVHNSTTILNPTDYDWKSDKYKDWFSEKTWKGFNENGEERPSQLCYSNEEMRKEFSKNLIEILKDATATSMLIGIEDNYDWCECDKCKESAEKYGTDSAVTIKFVNKLQEDVDKWFAKNKPGVNPTSLIIFAYHTTTQPPAKYNESTKKYEPIDDTVVLNPHSGVYFAPVDADITVPFEETEVKEQILGWGAVSQKIYSWIYALYPYQGLIFCNTVDVMQQNYQLLKDNNATMIIDQSDHYQKNVQTGFARLKAYLQYKLQWDLSLNMDELIDDFFVNYFGEASTTMQELFDKQRGYYSYLNQQTDVIKTISADMLNDSYWSYPQLQEYMGLINESFDAIAPLKESNPERYEKLYQRILLESIQYRYMLISLYGTEFGEKELLNEKNRFKYDFEELGLIRHKESNEITELWAEWEIN